MVRENFALARELFIVVISPIMTLIPFSSHVAW